MSQATDATRESSEIVVKVVAQGPSSVHVWSNPTFWTGKASFSGSVDFKIAGDHEVCFQLPSLPNQTITRKICNFPTTTYKDPSTNGVPSTSVAEGNQPCPPEPSEPTHIKSKKRWAESQLCCTTSCNNFAPQPPLTIPESPAAATIADSDLETPSPTDMVAPAADPVLSVVADLEGSPSKSLPLSRPKRGREEVEYSSGSEDEGGNPRKKIRVPQTQNGKKRCDV